MPKKPYTVAEIRRIVHPIAERYGVERVYLFGSYVRDEVTPNSDFDIRIDCGAICDLFELSSFHQELENTLSGTVDLLTTGSLEDKFLSRIANEEVMLYERS